MIVLYILLGILLAIIILLCFPIKAIIQYSEFLSVDAEYMFFNFRVTPREAKPDLEKEEKPKKEKKKKKKKKEPDKAQEERPSLIQTIREEEGLEGLIKFFKALLQNILSITGRLLRRIFSHFIFQDIIISMLISDKNAAKTAIKYGQTCEAVFPAMGALCSLAKVKKYDIDISPDFLGSKPEIEIYARVYFRPIFALAAAIAAGCSAIVMYFKLIRRKSKKEKVDIEKMMKKKGLKA